ncbi:DgyrCDS2846 [Dimorphilus gyrociliatus]|uniref:Choline transporter-like protein n=1 Tax=Dimorphilus gyrociliatus TaxID=2664684 RepID=A0A7I8VBH6_9ANNE|nr:DgyrCDS2846 [Dimorphilus gyrociliatus]
MTKVEDIKGEPQKFDPTFKGPIKDRGCTDIICCLLFIIFVLGMVAVSILGNPKLLLYPTDSDGNLCGYKSATRDLSDKPYLFYFDMLACAKVGAGISLSSLVSLGCPTTQICVEHCPRKAWSWIGQYTKEKFGGSKSGRSDMICKIPKDNNFYKQVCVEKCPSKYWAWPVQYGKEKINSNDKSGRSDMICHYSIGGNTGDARLTNDDVKTLVENENCAPYYVKSEPLIGRCIPSIFGAIKDKAATIVGDGQAMADAANNTVTYGYLEKGSKYLALFLSAKEYGVKIYQDVRASWWLILVGLGLAMLLSFIWIVLMRWLAGVIVWLTILLFVGLFGFATGYCGYRYWQMKDDPEHEGSLEFSTNLSYYTNLSKTWLALAIIAGIFLLIILILLIFLRSRIRIAISLIKASSRAIGNMVFTLFWPIIPFLLQLCLFGFWIAAALFLATMGSAKYAGATFNGSQFDDVTKEYTVKIQEAVGCNSSATGAREKACHFLGYTEQYTVYLQFFMLFMLFWVMNFIIALGQMTLAGSFASYYWAFNKPSDIPAFPVTGSLLRTLRYHVGTLAFGSLIIAIIQIIRVFLEYLDHKLKGKENAVAKFFLCCLKCFFWCLEKFMKFINKNAYILCAIYGKNFCISAKNAFFLIMRNVVRVVVVDKVTDFVMFIGKLVIVAAVAIGSFFVLSGDLAKLDIPLASNIPTNKNVQFVPMIIIIIGSYVIAAAFFSVYSMAVDTLFLCFLEDLERHDGTPEKPYYMSKDLMDILGKKNKMPKEKK